MKKLFTTIAILMATTAIVAAQSSYYGVKAGLNLATFSKASNATTILRGAVGGFMGYQVTDKLSGQVEALYSWQGTGYKGAPKSKVNYIKVPVLARMALMGNLTAEAGLSLNFLASSGHIDKDYLNGFGLGIPVGASYLLKDKYELGLRYELPLTNIGSHDSFNARNNVWLMSVAYRF